MSEVPLCPLNREIQSVAERNPAMQLFLESENTHKPQYQMEGQDCA